MNPTANEEAKESSREKETSWRQKKANEALCKVRMSSNERKKDRKVRSKTEYRTYGEQRLAKAGVACF